jgi:hypothetical protein
MINGRMIFLKCIDFPRRFSNHVVYCTIDSRYNCTNLLLLRPLSAIPTYSCTKRAACIKLARFDYFEGQIFGWVDQGFVVGSGARVGGRVGGVDVGTIWGVDVLTGVTGVLVGGMGVKVSVGAAVGTAVVGVGGMVGRGVLLEAGKVAVEDGLGVGVKYGTGVGGRRGT